MAFRRYSLILFFLLAIDGSTGRAQTFFGKPVPGMPGVNVRFVQFNGKVLSD